MTVRGLRRHNVAWDRFRVSLESFGQTCYVSGIGVNAVGRMSAILVMP